MTRKSSIFSSILFLLFFSRCAFSLLSSCLYLSILSLDIRLFSSSVVSFPLFSLIHWYPLRCLLHHTFYFLFLSRSFSSTSLFSPPGFSPFPLSFYSCLFTLPVTSPSLSSYPASSFPHHLPVTPRFPPYSSLTQSPFSLPTYASYPPSPSTAPSSYPPPHSPLPHDANRSEPRGGGHADRAAVPVVSRRRWTPKRPCKGPL